MQIVLESTRRWNEIEQQQQQRRKKTRNWFGQLSYDFVDTKNAFD